MQLLLLSSGLVILSNVVFLTGTTNRNTLNAINAVHPTSICVPHSFNAAFVLALNAPVYTTCENRSARRQLYKAYM